MNSPINQNSTARALFSVNCSLYSITCYISGYFKYFCHSWVVTVTRILHIVSINKNISHQPKPTAHWKKDSYKKALPRCTQLLALSLSSFSTRCLGYFFSFFQDNLCFHLEKIKSYFLPPFPLPLTRTALLIFHDPTIALQPFPSEVLQRWNIYKLSLKEGGFLKPCSKYNSTIDKKCSFYFTNIQKDTPHI